MLLSRVPPPSLSTPGRSRCAAQELKDTNKDTETSGIRAILVDESNKLHWKGEIRGPQGTAYEGGKFAVDIVLPNDYPFVPPKVRAAARELRAREREKPRESARSARAAAVSRVPALARCKQMKFDTKVWHPNVSSQSGAICLDILKNEWSPALTVRTALISLQALLSAPEPSDPQDAEVAKQYTEDNKTFQATAKFWTETYASGAARAPRLCPRAPRWRARTLAPPALRARAPRGCAPRRGPPADARALLVPPPGRRPLSPSRARARCVVAPPNLPQACSWAGRSWSS